MSLFCKKKVLFDYITTITLIISLFFAISAFIYIITSIKKLKKDKTEALETKITKYSIVFCIFSFVASMTFFFEPKYKGCIKPEPEPDSESTKSNEDDKYNIQF